MAMQTAQQTAKKYKLWVVLSVLVIVLGFVLLIFAGVSNVGDFGYYLTVIALLIMAGGLIWLAVAKFLAWWHHG